MPWKTPGGLEGRAPQSQNHLPFPKKRIFRLANRKLVESKALSPRSQLQDVTKILDRNYAVASSYVSPFQGFADWWVSEPRALPWAGMSRPFRADSNIAEQPFTSRSCHCP
jgi:hypothetical protein